MEEGRGRRWWRGEGEEDRRKVSGLGEEEVGKRKEEEEGKEKYRRV